MPRFPPRGPHGRLFPRFHGTIKALRLPAGRPAALRCLRTGGTTGARMFRSRRRCVQTTSGLGLVNPVPPSGISSVETTGSLKFLGNPDSRLHMVSDPGRPIHPRPLRDVRVAPALVTTKAPTTTPISRLNSMAFGLAAYASRHCLRRRARLASRCWSGAPGRAFTHRAPIKGFNSLHVFIPLFQAS